MVFALPNDIKYENKRWVKHFQMTKKVVLQLT